MGAPKKIPSLMDSTSVIKMKSILKYNKEFESYYFFLVLPAKVPSIFILTIKLMSELKNHVR